MTDVASFDRWARWYDLTSPAMDRDVLAAGFRFADRDVERVLVEDVGMTTFLPDRGFEYTVVGVR